MTTRSAQPDAHDRPAFPEGKPRRRQRQPASADASAGKQVPDTASERDASQQDDGGDTASQAITLKRCLKSIASTGIGVSVVVHAILLVLLSLFVMTRHSDETPWLTSSFAADNTADLDFTEIEQFTLEPLASSDSIQIVTATMPQAAAIEPPFLSTESNVAAGTESASGGTGVRPPGGANAVTKGSFTAWTVPADPAPREDYLVVILVRVPEKIRKYEKEDLSGFLEGDDGYETPIGNFTGKGFPKQFYGQFDTGARRLVIRIPGAAAKVRDTIRIRSKILREEQTMEIVF